MAVLTSGAGSLSMEIVGYQFVREDDPDDWLNVRLVARRGDERWDLVDPCLMKDEVPALCSWLRDIASGDYSRTHFSSVEDQPAFGLSDDRTRLAVSVGVWKLLRKDGVDWVELEFPLDPQMLIRFASELAADAERFVTRHY